MKAPHIGLNAHLLASGASYRRAGIHGYIYHLLERLPDADPDLRYTVFVGEGRPPQHERLAVHISRWRTGIPWRRVLWEQVALPRLLACMGVDLLHAMAFVSPLLSGRPSVVTVYDLSFSRYPELFRPANRLYLRLFTRLSCKRAGAVVAISESTARDVETLLGIPRGKIIVATPGLDRRFRPLPQDAVETFRAEKGLPERFIMYLGTLEPRKNLVTLLKAYALVAGDDVPTLILAGAKGWMYEGVFKAIEKLGLVDRVILPGYIPDEELPFWYNAAEVFVYPSLYEGFGLPLVEAMACGTPVIAADTSSLPEAVGDAGVLLPPTDIHAWADTISRAVADDAWRAEMSRRGIEKALDFSWERTAIQTVRAYHLALERGR